jgi:sphinganine-1-phosphate aldolase
MHSEWPLINLMEAEIISMMQDLLHGKSGAPGIITHGGSTSILEACKAYVLAARQSGIDHPEIIVPDSAHVAFDKAAETLDATLVKVPVDPKTGGANVRAMDRAITGNTCLLVGSAPSFPMGVMDPIQQLGQLALRHRLPLHVDSCLGGGLTVFAKEAGFHDIPPCDFSVAGVTSISIDTHKYFGAPKGTSVLVFSKKANVSPTQTHLDWTGGMYVTQGIDGSRSGADIAVLWTLLFSKGRAAYVQDTFNILSLQRLLVADIQKIEGIVIPYQTYLSVIPVQTAKGINAMVVAEQFEKRGWSVNLLQTADQKPNGFHFCLTSVHTHQENFVHSFVTDLRAAVQFAKDNPLAKPTGIAKAYGSLGKVPRYIQDKVGKMYTTINNSLPGVPIEGLNPPAPRPGMKSHNE